MIKILLTLELLLALTFLSPLLNNPLILSKIAINYLPLEYFVYSEDEQRGSTFGERFTNAIQDIYNLGFEQIISVGNDTPHLTKDHFAKAEEKLKTCPLVLGPSQDGGFYLMGLKKSHFNPVSFLKLPWQTSTLTASIVRLVQAKKIEALFLETLQDLDSAEDIQPLLNSTQKLNFQLRTQLKSAIKIHKPIEAVERVFFSQNYSGVFFNKGSPARLSA